MDENTHENANGVVFKNVKIFDGSGSDLFAGSVVVEGNRISKVMREEVPIPTGTIVIDGCGRTLMPGMIDAHLHLSWNNASSLEAIMWMPVEEHVLSCIASAKIVLDAGFTSGLGAAAAKPRLDVVIRDAINSGAIPGPRYLAASPEFTTIGGLGDTSPPHIELDALTFGTIVTGPDEMRAGVRRMIKYGNDVIKLNLSGEDLTPTPAEATPFTDEEVAAACDEALKRKKMVSAHARSADAIKQCIRHGIRNIYHASYADEEALDMLEAAKETHFVAPGLAWLHQTARGASQFGLTPDSALAQMYERELGAAITSMKSMHKRGIKIAIGGDYGFAWTPMGTNATDLQYFVELLDFSPLEALAAATSVGAEMMGMADSIGRVKEGYLADLLLVDGDPSKDVRILQQKQNIYGIMKDGQFHKFPH
ncbi:MAG: amidohydrolase family protein [Haliea sp.]